MISNLANDPSAGTAIATARKTNPGLMVFWSPSMSSSQTWSFTYGSGFENWAAVNDTLGPNTQGQIRGFASSDWGCTQLMDGIRGFALNQPTTAQLMEQASYYSWKYSRMAQLGVNGIWSDNLVPGDWISAGWFYGSCAPSASSWDAGLTTILGGLRNLTGGAMVGGNDALLTYNNTIRQNVDMAMHETLQTTIAQGPGSVASGTGFAFLLSQVQAWQAATNTSGNPKILIVMDNVLPTATQRMRYGLALTTILGGAYIPYQSHSDLYQPAEMTHNGIRGYLGQPTAPAVQVGASAWKRTFEHGIVYANMSSSSVVIDGVTVPAQDGVFWIT